jgi:branched-chain amino acid transport system permease protein
MVYGVLQLINFAHGDVLMVGAMLVLVLARAFGYVGPEGIHPSVGGFLMCSLIAIVACGVLGFLIERLAYRPLRDKPRINSLITAIGISLLLEFGGQHPRVFGPTPQPFPGEMVPGINQPLVELSFKKPTAEVPHPPKLVLSRIDALIAVVTLTLMLALTYIVLYTKIGLGLRAVSFRFDTAALMGVNINRVISFTFILGSVLAAVAGILFALRQPRVDPLMGLLPGMKAFVAAVFGGIGNIAGAVLGGVMIGVVEVMIVGFLPNGSQYKDAVAFVILIVILLVKPTGLLGQNVVEKV